MDKIKALNEKLGNARKRKSELVNDRASKIKELEALVNAETVDQTAIDAKNQEIGTIKTDIKNQDEIITNLTDQLADQSDVNSYEPIAHENFNPNPEANELKNYSFAKAISSMVNGEGLSGFEKEMHQEAIKDSKDGGYKLEGNLAIPQSVLGAPIKNALSVDGGSGGDKGGLAVETTKGSFIDILKAKLPFTELGATWFTDLTGDVSFPKAVEGTDPAIKTEVATADEVDPTLAEVTLSPQRIPGFLVASRKLFNQGSYAVEQWIRNHLAYKISKVMHSTIITDINAASGTNAVVIGTDGGALTWAKVVEFETAVLEADAAMENEPSLKWLTTPGVRGHAKTVERATNTGKFLLDDNGRMNGYDVVASSLVPSNLTKGSGTNLHAAIFANWAALYIGQWGGLDLLVNPYSLDTTGQIRVSAWTFMDDALAQAEAFSVSKEIDVS